MAIPRRGRTSRARASAGVVALALVLSSCAWIAAGSGRPGNLLTPLQILSPADRSQAPADGTVTVTVRLSDRVSVASARAWLRTGIPNIGTAPAVEITDRLELSGRIATATLDADDLEPGISTIFVRADRNSGAHRPAEVSTTFSWEPAIEDRDADRCDPLDTSHCLLPFPNDHLTVADASTDTGRRVAFDRDSMPRNAASTPVDPSEWNRNDGFSPGSMILAQVPGIDLGRMGAAPITDIGRSLDHHAPIVLLDADTGERHPYWAELDANTKDPDKQALIVRPARNLEEGHRYVVALRRIRDGAGKILPAPRAFEVLRDNYPTFVPELEDRRPHVQSIFDTLGAAGVPRHNLYLAWDFTVASTRNLTERLLHIRDDAFASLGEAAPGFAVTSVEEPVDELIARRVKGTFEVPLYLTGDGKPGEGFHTGPDGLPARNGTYTAPFTCLVPHAAIDADGSVDPARGAVYGHGLLGSHDEVNAGNVRRMANEHDMVFCATDWIGMAEEDILNALVVLFDVSKFPAIPDRSQQGVLNAQFLARLLKDPNGFASDPAFRAGPDDTPVLRPGEVYYDGNSQGGIIGGAATAISTEWERAVLGVPGVNYSTLLRRSIDFLPFHLLMLFTYPDALERTIGIAMLQMLWDRGDGNGYAHHLTDDPLPGTPPHEVLMHVAWNDHQVAHISAEVEARTIGAAIHRPALGPGRNPDVEPHWGIPAIPGYPFGGSAMIVWDSGTPQVPLTNTAPFGLEYGRDPHENPRNQVAARVQKSEFLRPDGRVVDVCGGAPCLAP